VSLVLDSSATLGWVYLDEANPIASQTFELVAASGAWVPIIWRLEVANSLQIGIRRGRIDTSFRDTALADLARLNISIDLDNSNLAWTIIVQLADRCRLTVYDAAYLELAQRRSLPLGSLDRALCAAARALGVAVIGD
jgi:predicted nucleic acid-binding protein